MSQLVPPKPRPINVRRGFVLVASQFNAEYVQGLVTHCTDELRNLSPASSVVLHLVPGAFEIPLIVREVALQKEADAIVALGVILQGETAHAELLGQVVSNALQEISLEHGVPVIHAVLSLKDEAQARRRCLEDEMNRGTEAARAAFEMANLVAELRK
ncbi:MAG TPA: 6,7-dimethyl-8-ribityllumazine synthase [Chthoniobacterales bacterium]|jgi:6,7-dimethyl-8-ribityllumazine synthase|nr:6,7-dimethyl-8-ribityllumazine synthase [Chthoniobacterales bacterium]